MSLPKFIKHPDPSIYMTGAWLAIDLETTNLTKGDAVNGENYIVYGYYVTSTGTEGHITSESDIKGIETLLYDADFVVVQGGKFELKWFKRSGIDISRILIYDTLLGEFVIAGNRKFALDLDSISRRYGGEGKASLVSKLIDSGVCPSTIPTSILRSYCKQDVTETIRIFHQQRVILHKDGLLPVFFLRCITTPVLAEIETNGIFLDKESVLNVYRNSVQEYSEIIKALNVITGGINMASPQQVAVFLYDRLGFVELTDKKGNPVRGKANKAFPGGQPLTDEDTLVQLSAKTKEQREFIKLKIAESQLRRKITGYIERYMYACGYEFDTLTDKKKEFKGAKGTCVLNGTLNQSIAQTHRLTSSDPNLQNIDRKLKRVVTARKQGWMIRSADYKTLEFTTAGVVTGDAQIKTDIENKYDIHSYTSKVLTDSGQPTDRNNSKPHTFKPLYGGRSGSPAEQAYYQAFREKYHQCYKTQMDWVYEVLKTKKLRTASGLIFYWPDIRMERNGYITHTQQIFDYPVQSFATADIAPTGVCLLWHHMKVNQMKSFLINEVHDSVVLEQAPEESEKLGNLVEKCLSLEVVDFMEKVINFKITLPITVEQKVSQWWDFDGTK